jgi:hypothetical protein
LRSFYIACSPKFGEDLITSEYPCNAEKLNFSAATTFDARLRTVAREHAQPTFLHVFFDDIMLVH